MSCMLQAEAFSFKNEFEHAGWAQLWERSGKNRHTGMLQPKQDVGFVIQQVPLQTCVPLYVECSLCSIKEVVLGGCLRWIGLKERDLEIWID
mmetsp:Transcript_20452/g.44488  ORF Transcript_20452/g.44488 Transcript_20452/m.44488 type:complete len:92 (+) Transcript_20452:38-313(+)